MNPVEGFIIDLPEHQREILWKLHELILSFPEIRSRVKYKIPFYEVNKSVCYLNPVGKAGVELVFTRGFEIKDKAKVLKANGRTRVIGILFEQVSAIDERVLQDLIQKAIELENPKSI